MKVTLIFHNNEIMNDKFKLMTDKYANTIIS